MNGPSSSDVGDAPLRAFAQALREIPVVTDHDHLWERIVQTRVAHEESNASGNDRAAWHRALPKRRWPVPMTVGLAAAAVFVVFSQFPGPPPHASPEQPAWHESSSWMLSPWPRFAGAQTAIGTMPEARPSAAIVPMDVGRLVPGRWKYVVTRSDAHATGVPEETFERRLEPIGTPGRAPTAWRVITIRDAQRTGEPAARDRRDTDTLWLDGTSLRPVWRRMLVGALDVRQQFTDTTLTETIRLQPAHEHPSASGTQPDVERIPFRRQASRQFGSGQPFAPSAAALQVLLQAVPLGATWQGSVQVLDGDNRVAAIGQVRYLNLRVTGVDTLRTTQARIPCWRVVLETGRRPTVWWVSQVTGETLRTEEPDAFGVGVLRTYQL